MAGCISTISDLVIAVAAVVGATVAGVGVSAWRRELHGRTEYELARRVLIGVHRVRDEIGRVRSPFISGWEFADRPGRKPNQSTCDAEDKAYAYQNRWKPLQEVSVALDVDLVEAEVIWGDILKEAWIGLRKCTAELWVAISRYVQETGPLNERVERIVSPGSPDEYGERLLRAVSVFDDSLKHHLRRP